MIKELKLQPQPASSKKKRLSDLLGLLASLFPEKSKDLSLEKNKALQAESQQRCIKAKQEDYVDSLVDLVSILGLLLTLDFSCDTLPPSPVPPLTLGLKGGKNPSLLFKPPIPSAVAKIQPQKELAATATSGFFQPRPLSMQPALLTADGQKKLILEEALRKELENKTELQKKLSKGPFSLIPRPLGG